MRNTGCFNKNTIQPYVFLKLFQSDFRKKIVRELHIEAGQTTHPYMNVSIKINVTILFLMDTEELLQNCAKSTFS